MTWYFEVSDDGSTVDVWDHTLNPSTDAPVLSVDNPRAPTVVRNARGTPIDPDVPGAILDGLISRGQVDLFALLTIAEALTGAGLEEWVGE
jgi:hypothetical protein